MYYDLTKGKISKNLILFALPMMAGNLMQQFYNIADTLIVGRVVGKNALAAVGFAYTLMTFLTSIFLGHSTLNIQHSTFNTPTASIYIPALPS